jgi:hypothetical protein
MRPLTRKQANALTIALLVIVLLFAAGIACAVTPRYPSTAPICTRYGGSRLAGFVLAAESSWPVRECLSAPDKSLTVSSAVQVVSPVSLNFEGATVTGSSTLSRPILSVQKTAPGSFISRVTFTRSGGDGIDCHAQCFLIGVSAIDLGGFGVNIDVGANDSEVGGDSVDGEVFTEANAKTGVFIHNVDGVIIGVVESDFDNHYGVLLDKVTGSTEAPCSVASVVGIDTGDVSPDWPNLAKNNKGAPLELLDTTGCSVAAFTGTGQGGYGLALGGSSHNTFGTVIVTGEISGERNPGLNLAGGSAANTFATLLVNDESIAVDIGNNGVPGKNGEVGNDDNTISSLVANDDGTGVIDDTGGSDNTFVSVTGTGDGAYGSFYLGLIMFRTPGAGVDSGNVVKAASFAFSGVPRNGTAEYLVYADALTSGNSVRLSKIDSDTYSKAACHNPSRGNRFSGC